MGRAKAKMELIKKDKVLNNTFRDRSATLKRKVEELATLCGVKVVVIIYGPKQGTSSPIVPEVWPQDRDQVVELIDKYRGQSAEDRANRTTLVSDLFKERNKKAEKDLKEARKKRIQAKYPTALDPVFDGFREDEIRNSVVFLQSKIDNAKAKLEQMKANNSIRRACHVQQQGVMLSKKRSLDLDAGNQANKYMKRHPHEAIAEPMRVPVAPMPLQIQHQRFPVPDYDQNRVMLRFVDGYVGGASNMMHNAPLRQVVYGYPRMEGTLDSINYANNLAMVPQNYYGEGIQPIAQQVLEYHPMPQESSSHQMAAASHQYYQDGKWQW
ncbi:hypothetical protein DCAR_0207262 [Daucus carota subsp. sativus]|uniref:MADS-box domain-containing protein n=1 Tax=Daucus carota subsp. sativus TaxID=79200 RepID=A0AAF0WF78_DAUCS|nr:hypothetical protein DCAR_0207262 [Daucus carota subsp. sativus]